MMHYMTMLKNCTTANKSDISKEENSMLIVKINLANGDYITTRINCTAEEACNYYRIGSYINVGTAADDMQKIKSLEFIY